MSSPYKNYGSRSSRGLGDDLWSAFKGASKEIVKDVATDLGNYAVKEAENWLIDKVTQQVNRAFPRMGRFIEDSLEQSAQQNIPVTVYENKNEGLRIDVGMFNGKQRIFASLDMGGGQKPLQLTSDFGLKELRVEHAQASKEGELIEAATYDRKKRSWALEEKKMSLDRARAERFIDHKKITFGDDISYEMDRLTFDDSQTRRHTGKFGVTKQDHLTSSYEDHEYDHDQESAHAMQLSADTSKGKKPLLEASDSRSIRGGRFETGVNANHELQVRSKTKANIKPAPGSRFFSGTNLLAMPNFLKEHVDSHLEYRANAFFKPEHYTAIASQLSPRFFNSEAYKTAHQKALYYRQDEPLAIDPRLIGKAAQLYVSKSGRIHLYARNIPEETATPEDILNKRNMTHICSAAYSEEDEDVKISSN